MNKLLKCPKDVVIKYHYDEEDKKCSGDFYSAEIYFDDTEVFGLTDDYHDNTSAQFEGFLFACELIWGKDFPRAKKTRKNDAEI